MLSSCFSSSAAAEVAAIREAPDHAMVRSSIVKWKAETGDLE